MAKAKPKRNAAMESLKKFKKEDLQQDKKLLEKAKKKLKLKPKNKK